MKKISPIVTRVAIVAGLALGAFAVSALADWSQPLSAPPACTSGNPGCDAPIHVGYGPQTKQGGIVVNGLASAGTAMQYGLWVVNAPIWAQGGLIIETRSSDPATPANGRMWLITP